MTDETARTLAMIAIAWPEMARTDDPRERALAFWRAGDALRDAREQIAQPGTPRKGRPGKAADDKPFA